MAEVIVERITKITLPDQIIYIKTEDEPKLIEAIQFKQFTPFEPPKITSGIQKIRGTL